MPNSKKKIDLEKLNAESFTIADAMGMAREAGRPSAGAEETPHDDTGAASVSVVLSAPLRLLLERKGRGGKTVTRVTGLPSGEWGSALVKKLKQTLGCGAAVERGDVCFQGDQRARLLKLLEELGARNVKSV